ncbi:putative PilZ domain-containing protein [uncultured Thiomicrorhabdus sp.]|jgi:hypothetical protein
MSTEKRNAVRHNVHIPCCIIFDGIQVHGKLIDVSKEGVGISACLPFLKEGKTISLEIDTKQMGSDRVIKLDFEVRSLKNTDKESQQFGGILKNFTEKFHEWLDKVINTLKPNQSYFMQFARFQNSELAS